MKLLCGVFSMMTYQHNLCLREFEDLASGRRTALLMTPGSYVAGDAVVVHEDGDTGRMVILEVTHVLVFWPLWVLSVKRSM